MPVTVRQLLGQAGRLKAVSESPMLDLQLLLAQTLKCNRAALIARDEQCLTGQQQALFEQRLQRRALGEPLAYILGRKEFMDFELITDRRALVPRPETELLVERALAFLAGRDNEPLQILDLGTGTGAVALALARASSAWQVTATDIDKETLDLASENRAALGVTNLTLIQADWFDGLADRQFDLIISNPPYVAAGDPHLLKDGLEFEPAGALVAGGQGLGALQRIIEGAPSQLKPGGWLVLEHGYTQGREVGRLLTEAGFIEVACWQDLAGLDRVSAARCRAR